MIKQGLLTLLLTLATSLQADFKLLASSPSSLKFESGYEGMELNPRLLTASSAGKYQAQNLKPAAPANSSLPPALAADLNYPKIPKSKINLPANAQKNSCEQNFYHTHHQTAHSTFTVEKRHYLTANRTVANPSKALTAITNQPRSTSFEHKAKRSYNLPAPVDFKALLLAYQPTSFNDRYPGLQHAAINKQDLLPAQLASIDLPTGANESVLSKKINSSAAKAESLSLDYSAELFPAYQARLTDNNLFYNQSLAQGFSSQLQLASLTKTSPNNRYLTAPDEAKKAAQNYRYGRLNLSPQARHTQMMLELNLPFNDQMASSVAQLITARQLDLNRQVPSWLTLKEGLQTSFNPQASLISTAPAKKPSSFSFTDQVSNYKEAVLSFLFDLVYEADQTNYQVTASEPNFDDSDSLRIGLVIDSDGYVSTTFGYSLFSFYSSQI